LLLWAEDDILVEVTKLFQSHDLKSEIPEGKLCVIIYIRSGLFHTTV